MSDPYHGSDYNKVFIDSALLPWAEPNIVNEVDMRYSLDEIAVLSLLLINSNYCGEVLAPTKVILTRCFGRSPTREECKKLLEVVSSLAARVNEKDRIVVFAQDDLSRLKPSAQLNVVVKYERRQFVKGEKFVSLSCEEIDAIRKLSANGSGRFVGMLCAFLSIKSHMRKIEYFHIADNKKHDGFTSFVARSTIAKEAGVSTRTVDSYISKFEKSGLIGFRSGRAGYTMNTYTIPANQWILDAAEKQNAEEIKKIMGYAHTEEPIRHKRYGGVC